MTFTAIFGIGLDIYVVTDRIVSWCRLQCCRMAVTIYRRLTKLFPLIGQHLHQTIACTIALIIQWPMSLIRGVNQSGACHQMLLCSNALFVTKVIGASTGEEYPAIRLRCDTS